MIESKQTYLFHLHNSTGKQYLFILNLAKKVVPHTTLLLTVSITCTNHPRKIQINGNTSAKKCQ